MKKFLITLIIIVLLIVLVIGYLGFVPGLSTLMGTNKPIDLGVSTVKDSLSSADKKVNISRVAMTGQAPAGKSISYEGSHNANLSLSSAEFSALLLSGGWEFSEAVQNMQIKMDKDGKVEASALVDIDKLEKYLNNTGLVDTKDFKAYTDKIKVFEKTAPIYLAGTGEVVNNKVKLNLDSVKVGRLPIPMNSESVGYLSQLLERRISAISGFQIDSAKVEDGQLNFKGSLPNKVNVWPF